MFGLRTQGASLPEAVISEGLATVQVLALEVQEARAADDPIHRYFNPAGLGIEASAQDNG